MIAELTEGGRLTVTHDGARWWPTVPARSLTDEGPSTTGRDERAGPIDGDDPTFVPFDGEPRRGVLRGAGVAERREPSGGCGSSTTRGCRARRSTGSGSDAAVVRVPGTLKGLALATDGKGRFGSLDPYLGAMHAVAEAARNVAVDGARPLAITNCLNFGNPERPEVMWQFAESIRGMRDACLALGTPVTGGNVSFYNESGTRAIWPTPVIGMLGLLDDHRLRVPTGVPRGRARGRTLLGETFAELGGSEFAEAVLGVGGRSAAGARSRSGSERCTICCSRPAPARRARERARLRATAGSRSRSPRRRSEAGTGSRSRSRATCRPTWRCSASRRRAPS